MKEFSEKELLLLGYLEGDLSDSEKVKFEAMMAEDASLMAEYRQLERTKLPTQQVMYANKAALKRTATPPKKKPVLGYILWPAAVAASVALLFWFVSPSNNINNEITAANVHQSAAQASVNDTENKAPTTEKVEATTETIFADEPKTQAPPQKIQIVQTQSSEGNSGKEESKNEVHTKQLINGGELLAAKTVTIKVIDSPLPIVETVVETDDNYAPYTASEIDERGWFARTTRKINNQLGTWIGYIEQPQVDINKKEDANSGRTYWAITLETEKYEWEGRLLYTNR